MCDIAASFPLDAPNDHALLVVEYFPEDISLQCPGYYSYYTNAGLAHPQLHEFRQGVLICQHSRRFVYMAYGFDTFIHAGLPQDELHDYVSELLKLGYSITDPLKFSRDRKQITFLSHRRSYVVGDYFLTVNDGTPEFTAELEEHFSSINLERAVKSLLFCRDRKHLVLPGDGESRGQSCVLNLTFAAQNCTDCREGINYPKLTKSADSVTVDDIENGSSTGSGGRPLSHVLAEHMVRSTALTRKLIEKCGWDPLWKDNDRFRQYSASIPRLVQHPSYHGEADNGYEGLALGAKECVAGFDGHADGLTDRHDKDQRYTMVSGQMVDRIPANPLILSMAAFTLFEILYSRNVCGMRTKFAAKIKQFASDLRSWLSTHVPQERRLLGSHLLPTKG